MWATNIPFVYVFYILLGDRLLGVVVKVFFD